MPETLTPGADVAGQDVVAQANEIVEAGKQEDLEMRFEGAVRDGNYEFRVVDGRTGSVVGDIKTTSLTEFMRQMEELREADVD